MPLRSFEHTIQTLNAVMELLPVGVAIAHDAACTQITVNPAAARMLSVQSAANVSKSRSDLDLPFKVLKDGKELAPHELPMQRAAAEKIDIRDFEVDLVRNDGTVLRLLEYAKPLVDEKGACIGSIGIFVDITEQQRATTAENKLREQAANALREMNETLERRVAERTAEASARAEQLRNLALSLADAEARERKRLAQVLHDNLQQILSAARLRAGMVRKGIPADASGLTHLQSLESLLESASGDLRALTHELAPPVLYDAGLNPAIESAARVIEKKGGPRFVLSLDPRAEPQSEQIRVVLFESVREVINNAVEHARASTVRITTTVGTPEAVHITIEDDGDGFDVATLFQSRNRSTRSRLGLMEIRERLQNLGGGLDVHSQVGAGTRVDLHAPAALRVQPVDDQQPVQDQSMPPSQQSKSSSRMRVVVADDHAIFREGLVGLLEQEDFVEVVGAAQDGGQAVELVRKLRPDTLIVDISMPVMSGLEVTKILSHENPQLRIVGLSMHGHEDMARSMQEAGAAAYLSKDASSEKLVEVLRTLAGGGSKN